jgi:hypothetical protein
MTQPPVPGSFCRPVSSFEQAPAIAPGQVTEPLPPHAVLLETLRGVERRLQERGLLSLPALQQPLWFIAEQERNTFLWGRGLSLADANRFDFWVDLPRLVEQRLRDLSECHGPASGIESGKPSDLQYFEGLFQALHTIEKHLSALSRAITIVRLELEVTREIVLLPV